MIRPAFSGRFRPVSSLFFSVLFHLLLLLVLSLAFRRPLVEVPRSVIVELPNINEVPVRDVVAEQKRSVRPTGLNRLFVREDSVLPPSPVPVERPVSPEEPQPSLDEHRRRHREDLERFLEQESQVTPLRDRIEDTDLLSDKDRVAAEAASGGPAASGGSPAREGAPAAEVEVAARLVLEGAGRAVVYQPPPPVYPEWARREGVQGRVLVKVWFDRDGFAVDVQVIRSSGYPALDSVAKNYALKFRIAAISEDREEEGTVPVTFELVR